MYGEQKTMLRMMNNVQISTLRFLWQWGRKGDRVRFYGS